jgi:hypothetical protein
MRGISCVKEEKMEATRRSSATKADLSDHPDLPERLRAGGMEMLGQRFVYLNTRVPWLKQQALEDEEDRKRYEAKARKAAELRK